MAINFNEAIETTILDYQLPKFLEHHLSYDQITQYLQLINRQAASEYVFPKEMKAIELFYQPTDKNKQPLHCERKQLSVRFFISKDIWSQYLIEKGWVVKRTTKIVERFSFVVNKKLKHLLVTQKITTTDLDSDEFLSLLQTWKRISYFDFELYSKRGPQTLTNVSIRNISEFGNVLSIHSKKIPLIYYDVEQLNWLIKTGLYLADYYTEYRPEYSDLSRQERFKRYLKDAETKTKKDIAALDLDQLQLVVSDVHPYKLLDSSGETLLQQFKATETLRHAAINELISLLHHLDKINQKHQTMIPNLRYPPALNRDLLDDYLYINDLFHSNAILIPKDFPSTLTPDIFNRLHALTFKLIFKLGIREVNMILSPSQPKIKNYNPF